jgi:hypothetical protein
MKTGLMVSFKAVSWISHCDFNIFIFCLFIYLLNIIFVEGQSQEPSARVEAV